MAIQNPPVMRHDQAQAPVSVHQPRAGRRRRIALPGRLTWRDASGTLRFVSVVTRDLSETDVFVDCQDPIFIPLYRVVHFQLERGAPESSAVPLALRRQGRVVSAVYRIGRRKTSTGAPDGYALRLMVEPRAAACEPVAIDLAVAN